MATRVQNSSMHSRIALPKFAMLVVSGKDAVRQFDLDYPTEHSRHLLAQQIDSGHHFTKAVPYDITLHEYADWSVGSGFDSFVQTLVPRHMQWYRRRFVRASVPV